MGFDPRRWRPSPPGSRPLTSNVEALLEENEALRREVRSLRLQLEVLQRAEAGAAPQPEPASRWDWPASEPTRASARRGEGPRSRVTVGSSHGISPDLVERWGRSMASHRHWQELRIGPPGGLRGLEEELRRHWWNPALTLEQELDRRSPGLGSELVLALRGPNSRWRWAVRSAFALYGPRAPEWLSEEPLRVVEELWRRVQQLERQGAGSEGRRGTRTENHSGAAGGAAGPGSGERQGNGPGRQERRRTSGREPGAGRERSSGRSPGPGHSRSPSDPRAQALALLGLEADATPAAIKRAYRRLAKAHHPDLGGDVEAFRRLDAAYRSLL